MNAEEHESKTFTDEQLLNSPTIQRLSLESNINPVNINVHAEIEKVIAPSYVYLVAAIDNGAIQFESKAYEDALLQILLVCHQLITQMRPTSPTLH